MTKRGPLHFVRRRRLVRTKVFDPSQFLPPDVYKRCDHCDSEAVEELSDKMLEALSIATLLQRPADGKAELTDGVVLPLKDRLIDDLKIKSELPAWLVKVGDPHTRLRRYLLADLDKFPDRSAQLNLLSRASFTNMFNRTEVVRDGLSDRMGEIAARYFGREEREAMARLAIKHLDPEFRLHCCNVGCGDTQTCQFSPVWCENVGCGRCVSRLHSAEHDAECGFKLVSCPKGCGSDVPRQRVNLHLKRECALRDAECPFKNMGCSAVVMAKDLARHLTDGAGSHLILIAAGMEDLGSRVEGMEGRVGRLEGENAELRKMMEENEKGAKKEIGNVRKDATKVGKEVSTLHKDVGRLRADLKKLTNARSHKK